MRRFLLSLLAAHMLGGWLEAGEMRKETTPSSLWLDLRSRLASQPARDSFPDWLESVQVDPVPGQAGTGPVRLRFRYGAAPNTTYRLRFRYLRDLKMEMQLRLFFEDQPRVAPTVSGWSETGAMRFEDGPIGDAVGLPTSETLTLPMAGVDYIDITTPGDGRNIRGVFLALVKNQEVRRAADFQLASDSIDPFENLPAAKVQSDDSSLYGRVKAALDPAIVKLTAGRNPECSWEFDLQSPPLLATISFEVLNADPLAPVELIVNGRPLGGVQTHLPDLADPGYVGSVRPLERDMRFRYSGWLHCQKAIPGSALQAGLNKVSLRLSKDSGPVAVRALEFRLKHNWRHLDYNLSVPLP